MCGITGFIHHTPDSETVINTMTDALLHRGPDAGGVWRDDDTGIALGHRRLSIVDLSPAGSQPMTSASGRYVMVYNGEIYNFTELRPELMKSGYAFRGHSDTEVLLAAIETWGTRTALDRSSGMFAFALWDRSEHTLTLARDRVGKKPLYYGWCNGAFLFGSELKALARHPAFDTTINRSALGELMRLGWIPEPLSIYSSIRKLPPGCLLQIKTGSAAGAAEPEYYWRANEACRSASDNGFSGNYAAATNRLDALLHAAVGRRMVADVELGALLSGGIDSTSVVALMQQQAERPVKTFSIGFAEPRFNEAEHAAAIARHLGTDHHELYVTPEQCLDVVGRLPAIYDEPFADISQVPTLLVSQLARKQVKVVLSGDGGDELFAGYTHYSEALRQWPRLQHTPAPLRRLLRTLALRYEQFSWRLFSNSSGRTMPGWQRLGSKLEKRTRGVIQETPQQFLIERNARYLQPENLVLGYAVTDITITEDDLWLSGTDPLQQMQHLDYIGYLPGDILVKVDRASMAVGLEVRAPILDTSVADFAWSLPVDFLVDRNGGKRILKDVMRRYVPRELTDRPKRGFSMPIEDWLRGPLHDWALDLLDPAGLVQQGFFNPESVETIWKQHMAGWRNHSNLLWSILMFQSWLSAGSG
ncbi:MAG: asparagine synthase (glutamine-hydrolyzing) [Thiohalobacterales bacterium]